MPSHGAAQRVGLEERGRDDVLDLRRAGQRVHGEGERAQRDGAGDQPLRDVALPEQSPRRTDRPRTPPRTATRRRRSAARRPARSTASRARARPGRWPPRRSTLEKPDSSISLPNTAPSMNTGKYSLRKPTILSMNTPVKIGATSDGSVSSTAPAARDRREQDDAVAAIGDEHQQREGQHHDDEAHVRILNGRSARERAARPARRAACAAAARSAQ